MTLTVPVETDDEPGSGKRAFGPTGTAMSWLVAGLLASAWAAIALVRHRTLHTGVDLGLYGQAVEQYAHLHAPSAALKAQGSFNLLGDHFTPLVAALAPLYRLWPSVELLLVAQAALIGLTVLVIGRTARRVLGDAWGAAAVALAFGTSWGVAGMALFDFHEVAFALPLLAVCLDRAIAGRWTSAVWWSLPLMLVKEDGAFLIFGLGLSLWAAGQRRLAWRTMALAVGLFTLVVLVIIPALSYSGTYTYWASTSVQTGPLRSAVGMLGNLLHAAASGTALLTVGLALACTLLLPLRSPLILVAVPSLLARFTSPEQTYWGTHGQYNATLMVVMFCAALDGAARGWPGSPGAPNLARRRVRVGCLGAVAAAAVIAAATWAQPLARPGYADCSRCSVAREVLARIPSGTTVLADTYLADQLVDRDQVGLAAQHLVDSTGHPYRAEWIALDVRDPDTFASIDEAYWWGSNAAQGARYIPVFASPEGYVLFHYDPPAAYAFNRMYGVVACAASASEAALCTTPPGDDTYRTRTAWCESAAPPHRLFRCPSSAYLKPYVAHQSG